MENISEKIYYKATVASPLGEITLGSDGDGGEFFLQGLD